MLNRVVRPVIAIHIIRFAFYWLRLSLAWARWMPAGLPAQLSPGLAAARLCYKSRLGLSGVPLALHIEPLHTQYGGIRRRHTRGVFQSLTGLGPLLALLLHGGQQHQAIQTVRLAFEHAASRNAGFTVESPDASDALPKVDHARSFCGCGGFISAYTLRIEIADCGRVYVRASNKCSEGSSTLTVIIIFCHGAGLRLHASRRPWRM